MFFNLYCSPSQIYDEFDDFSTKFDLPLSNINHEFPLCSIVMGDFNACCLRWWQNDITNSAGQEIDSLTLSAGYKQIIDKPTHIVNNSGGDVSIFDECHHNIIFDKVNISVPLPLIYIYKVSGIAVKQTWKIISLRYVILVGVKLLKIFL